jgi:hypothetical protein
MPLHAYTGLSSVPWVLVILIATRFVADERTKMSLTIDSPAKGSVA